MYRNKKDNGFTIVELLFAMSFITVLLIIAMISSLNIMRTYNKGLVLKQVNQSGRAIGTEMQRSLKAAQPPIEGNKVAEGRLCLGAYSYIWSVGGRDPYRYDNGDRIGFAKVSDSTGTICSEATPTVARADAVELLEGSTSTLAVQSASLATPASANGYYLYSFTFTLGTDDAELLNDDRDACRVDESSKEFCALNRFRITASARGV